MSKKKRDWKLFIMEILESINKIEKYIEGLNYEQFVRDEKTKDAVVRNLEIIGEAANQLPKEIQQKFSNVPWAQIIAMRNRMIHGYFAIDYRIVWNIVKLDIPSLKKELELILQKGGEE
jgi:uncharacterized protein with HEPN domain